jgi:hypothetical protein
MKECIKCGISKDSDGFPKSGNICKLCKNEFKKNWKVNNESHRNRVKEYNEKYYELTKESRKVRDSEYYQANKELINERKKRYKRSKMNDDPVFRLKVLMYKRINQTIKRLSISKSTRTNDIVGCSYPHLKDYIESKFESWMNWGNYGLYNGELDYGWDIDHIIPLSTCKNEEDVINLNHYTNLQPLCSKINRDIKRNNI